MPEKAMKGLKAVDEAKGEVTAVFATLNVIDKDGDVTRPGAFEKGAPVRISAYNHASWGPGILPVGKGVIQEVGNEAILEGKFFMDTIAGKETFLTVKELGPLGEWSYGYDVMESAQGQQDGRDVQFLDSLKVHEVSPVILGAGENTRTLATKLEQARKQRVAIEPHDSETSDSAWDGAAVMRSSVSEKAALTAICAWAELDPADPNSKTAYRFPHHSEPGGPANIRACLNTIAVLNGGKGAGIPDEDRQGVYDHAVKHLRDAGVEDIPTLRSGEPGEAKLADRLQWIAAEAKELNLRVAEVMARRAEKGKNLGDEATAAFDQFDAAFGELRDFFAASKESEQMYRKALELSGRAGLLLSSHQGVTS
jgi:hypothetical protein